jgi:hypothetical protein
MNPMFCRTFLRLSVLVAGLTLAFTSLHAGGQDNPRRGRKYKIPPPSSRIEVTVVRDFNGKPIEHAAVIFHPVEGDRDKGVMELKSNFDGKAVIDVIPIGDTVRLQVIAKGFQTYGDEFKIDKESMTMEVRMKRPGEQYSIYKDHAGTPKSDTNPAEDKSVPPAKEAKPAMPPNEAENHAQPKPETN